MPAITWIGVDVAKESLDVAYACGSGVKRRSVANSRTGHSLLVESLPRQTEARIVVEATGGYERALGKKPKVIIAACMRKLLVILNTMLKNNTSWKTSAAL
jgi:transposase